MSTSIGPKGAKLNFSSRGTYLNTSIPGTGIYNRTKLSQKQNNMNTETNNTSGCRYGCGILSLLFFLLGVVAYWLPQDESFKVDDNYFIGLGSILIITLVLFSPEIIKHLFHIKELIPQKEIQFSSEDIVSRYEQDKQVLLERIETEIENKKYLLSNTSNTNKSFFLKSFIECHKTNCLLALHRYYRNYNGDDVLDPNFNNIAYEIIKYNTFNYQTWINNGHDGIKYYSIQKQLFECGIIDRLYTEPESPVLVRSKSHLKKILNKIDGKTLLSKEDKETINKYLDDKEASLIGESKHNNIYENLTVDIQTVYTTLFDTCSKLSECDTVWEILSSKRNTILKSSANKLIDRNKLYGLYVQKKSFCYVNPGDNTTAIFLNINNGIFIYPKWVICLKEDSDFDVYDIDKFEIEFKRSRFIEEKEEFAPKDAKFLIYTYEYVNKNGSPDARYSYNPKYPVYEYGDITFKNLDKTIQFSNADAAERFFLAFQELKSNSNEIDSSDDKVRDPIFGATKQYFNDSQEAAKSICSYYYILLSDVNIIKAIDSVVPDKVGVNKDKLNYIFLADLVWCYSKLGHNISDLFCAEGLPLALVEAYVADKDFMSLNLESHLLDKCNTLLGKLSSFHKTLYALASKDMDNTTPYLNDILSKYCDIYYSKKYQTLLYRFFSVVAKADGTISEQESLWLESLMSNIDDSEHKDSNKNKKKRSDTVSRKTSSTKNSPITKLQSLIGLNEVKKEVMALTNFVKIQKEREAKGLKSVGLSYHCVFTGNPGTGKTTVARILAEIYKNLGIIKSGHLVETDRSGLVAEYVGQTAVKTNKIIDSAIDGVLFIDEAYSLVQGENNDFGMEAIATLLKRMEDDRDRLVVVLAGYSNEMKDFIDSNPGLQSRFNRYINFEDYSKDELKEIFKKIIVDYEYKLSEESETALDSVISEAVANKDKNFGNGRYVRNLFEKTIQNQAVRLSRIGTTTVSDLTTICPEDINDK